MRFLRQTLFVLAGLLSIGDGAHAKKADLVWSEWGTSFAEMRGPEHAEGLLLYFHGRGGGWAVHKHPTMSIFTEMAKVANWDILRLNRHPEFDQEPFDDDILRAIAKYVAHARRAGYRKIIVGGGSGGGWLSLLAAALPGVDAALAFAPGTTSGRSELLRTAKKLGQVLAGAKAPRIAVFFFEGDFLEDLEIRRSSMIRDGLERSGSTFTIVDHPPDLHGHGAMVTGRLVRRYRDCLLKLVREADLPPGEAECSRTTGFAVGSDIGFPASSGSLMLPTVANPALLPYLGRWEGDTESGAYLIMEATTVGPTSIDFTIGHSPAIGSGQETWIGTVPFQLNSSDGSISTGNWGATTARLTAAIGLELEHQGLDENDEQRTRRILLRKRTE